VLVPTAFLAAPLPDQAARPIGLDAVVVGDALDALEQERAAALRALTIAVSEALGATTARARAKRAIAARAVGARVARIETQATRAAILRAAAGIGDTFGAGATRHVAERQRAPAVRVRTAARFARRPGHPRAAAARRARGSSAPAARAARHSRAARAGARARAGTRRSSRSFTAGHVELERARFFRRAGEREHRDERAARAAASVHRGAFSPRRRRSSSSRAFGASGEFG
jgi:hypothetical protein